MLEGEVWAIPPMGRIGTMSLDATQQRLYEFVTWTTMVTRFAVEGGLDVETAYTLSDLYIQMADQTKETTELDKMQGVDISNYLGFGSQSYFIQVFKKQTGCTPHQYRRKNFCKHWTSKPQ